MYTSEAKVIAAPMFQGRLSFVWIPAWTPTGRSGPGCSMLTRGTHSHPVPLAHILERGVSPDPVLKATLRLTVSSGTVP